MSLFEHQPHPHAEARREQGPVKIGDQHPSATRIQRFNARLAVGITAVVGSMWCAYAFACFDLISLPAAIRGGSATIVSWIAQTFLQLVLLSIIMVGQDVQAKASDARAEQTYQDAEAVLHGQGQTAKHLEAQDAAILQIQQHLIGQDAALGLLVDRVGAALNRLPPPR